jgi:hypothetical protein
MLPAELTRNCWPVRVWRPSTLIGWSLTPSSMPTTNLGRDQVLPPSRERTTRYWLSNSSGDSHSASFCPFSKATTTVPSGRTVWHRELVLVAAAGRPGGLEGADGLVGAGDLPRPRPGPPAVVAVGGEDRRGRVVAVAGLEPGPGEVGPAVERRVPVAVGDHPLLVVEQLPLVQVAADPAGHHHRLAPGQAAVLGARHHQVAVAGLGAIFVEGEVERGMQDRPRPDVKGGHWVAAGTARVLDRHVAGLPGLAPVEAGVELVAAAAVVVGGRAATTAHPVRDFVAASSAITQPKPRPLSPRWLVGVQLGRRRKRHHFHCLLRWSFSPPWSTAWPEAATPAANGLPRPPVVAACRSGGRRYRPLDPVPEEFA